MSAESPRLADYQATTDYLYALKSGGVNFGIDRMRQFAKALGHPERAYPTIHVAGTNGKGSVSAMVESILRAAGLRTGLYTSPHLVKLGERVQVDRRILTEEEIVRYTNELLPVADALGRVAADLRPTFFEFMTAMAFLQFARAKVDAAVIEVGLGGRLDATNVVQPDVTVITSIGVDHIEQLGGSIPQIAREKAGIIKAGCPVVIGRLPIEAEEVVRAVAVERGSPVVSVREEFGADISCYPATRLAGDYQRWNAATATLIARLLQKKLARIDEVAVMAGLANVQWPGRWERVRIGARTVILDSSHNPEGATVLEENLRQLVADTGQAPIVVTGVLGEYRARALLDVIGRYAKAVYLVTPNQARACNFEELERFSHDDLRARLHRATVATVFPDANTCAIGESEDVVVVTGSLYLLGEVLERIQPERGAGEGKLQDF